MHDKDNLIHHEYDTSEDKNITEIETFEHYGEKIHESEVSISTETSQVLTVFNKAIHHDRIPSTTPGAEPPRDARDSGSARPHSTHLETSSSDQP